MRVLLLNHFPLTGSGSGVYTLNIAHALLKKGHEVCAIMPENQVVGSDEYPFKVHPVYFDGCTDGALDYNFPCFTTHPRSNMTFEDLSEERFAQYKDAFKQAIAEEIEAFEPDVVHAGHIWVLPALAADFNLPLVITAHGTDLMGYQSSDRFRPYAQRAFDAASSIIAISAENSKLVNDLFEAPEGKAHLILNGYNSDVFYPEVGTGAVIDADLRQWVFDHFGIEGAPKKLVSFAGKFAHFKGIDILLKAAAQYEDEDTVTILAGDGELFDSMNELAEELGLKNVYFVHNQPHDILRKVYSSADVSLLTSRKEPFGLVMIEALACGAPVIGSDDGGAVDVLNNTNGLLFQSENPDDLASKVKSVLAGEVTFDRAAIAESTKAGYSLDHSIDNTIALYRAALG